MLTVWAWALSRPRRRRDALEAVGAVLECCPVEGRLQEASACGDLCWYQKTRVSGRCCVFLQLHVNGAVAENEQLRVGEFHSMGHGLVIRFCHFKAWIADVQAMIHTLTTHKQWTGLILCCANSARRRLLDPVMRCLLLLSSRT